MLRKSFTFLKRVCLPHNDPSFIIAGAQKSGTTSLYHYLNKHPNLCGSSPKELHYFNRDYYFEKSYDSYRSHFVGNRRKKYFEATPAYIYHPNAMENIKEKNPNMKIILIFREPVSRAFSAWNHYREVFERNKGDSIKSQPRKEENLLYELFFSNKDEFPSFIDCIEIELKLMEKDNPPFEPSLIRRGLYYQQLKRCFQLFPVKNIMIFGFLEFITNPEVSINKICNFLSIPRFEYSPLEFKPINKKNYKDKLLEKDRNYLNSYYHKENAKLFELIGHINW